MNKLLLAPTDVLFFRDGRPMGGSLAGHGAAWPLPTVTNAALHAALWRSGLAGKSHVHVRNGPGAQARTERFGSLTTAGPFPVCADSQAETWFFPRPLDADHDTDTSTIQLIAAPSAPLPHARSSGPLPWSVASLLPPTKDKPAPWWNERAWTAYLTLPCDGSASARQAHHAETCTRSDVDFSDREATIGIDRERGAQDGERFYSAHYLRLREGWRLGLLAETTEKTGRPDERSDLIRELLTQSSQLLVGGQQRLCSATLHPLGGDRRLPMPLGKTNGFGATRIHHLDTDIPRYLVKWVLLTPAIFPALPDAAPPHPGGWLPSWVHPITHAVQLRAPLAARDPARISRANYRKQVQAQPVIPAHLVAALVDKPIPITGWSLGTPDNGDGEPRAAGAKPTHLAVPAGSVYYFACDNAEAAAQLAAALNWHGDTPGNVIRNRRSTLLGEKGFGLGVCGTWTPHGQA